MWGGKYSDQLVSWPGGWTDVPWRADMSVDTVQYGSCKAWQPTGIDSWLTNIDVR